MATYRAEAQIRAERLIRMGAQLGQAHFLLWRKLALLHVWWKEFRTLYAGPQEVFDLMNHTAPEFFVMVNQLLWNDVLLRLCRLTDPPKTGAGNNLTVRMLSPLVQDHQLKSRLDSLVARTEKETEFARERRDKLLAHDDLVWARASKVPAAEPATRAKIETALATLGEILNEVEHFYCNSTTRYADAIEPLGGTQTLIDRLGALWLTKGGLPGHGGRSPTS